MEDSLKKERSKTPNVEVDGEIFHVIPDIGFFGSKDSTYSRIVDLYYHVKKLVACEI